MGEGGGWWAYGLNIMAVCVTNFFTVKLYRQGTENVQILF